ncbi:hypothetical protein L1887_48975 [Cichorium endivia]|nr:hypothetical protein L1887_48975 [Cichorium endivia]
MGWGGESVDESRDDGDASPKDEREELAVGRSVALATCGATEFAALPVVVLPLSFTRSMGIAATKREECLKAETKTAAVCMCDASVSFFEPLHPHTGPSPHDHCPCHCPCMQCKAGDG